MLQLGNDGRVAPRGSYKWNDVVCDRTTRSLLRLGAPFALNRNVGNWAKLDEVIENNGVRHMSICFFNSRSSRSGFRHTESRRGWYDVR